MNHNFLLLSKETRNKTRKMTNKILAIVAAMPATPKKPKRSGNQRNQKKDQCIIEHILGICRSYRIERIL